MVRSARNLITNFNFKDRQSRLDPLSVGVLSVMCRSFLISLAGHTALLAIIFVAGARSADPTPGPPPMLVVPDTVETLPINIPWRGAKKAGATSKPPGKGSEASAGSEASPDPSSSSDPEEAPSEPSNEPEPESKPTPEPDPTPQPEAESEPKPDPSAKEETRAEKPPAKPTKADTRSETTKTKPGGGDEAEKTADGSGSGAGNGEGEGAGSGEGSSGGAGGTGVDRKKLVGGYVRKVARTVAEHRYYPRLARRNGLEGVVILKLTIDEDGTVLSVEVEQSSGHGVLDRAALEALRELEALPRPPRALGWKQKQLRVPVRYNLE
jgi:protein TonB